jgi:MFS family permease
VSGPLLRPDLAPLRSKAFRAVFGSRTIAMFGSQAAEVALLVQAKQLTGSPLVVGLLGTVEVVPLVVFGLAGGALADRFDRRTLMRWCEPGMACCAVVLLVNALLPRPALWPLFVVAALLMAITALQRPSFEAVTPRLVPAGQLTAAVTLLALFQNASVLVGSSLGGILAITPGPWLVYALDAAGFAGSFKLLGRLPALPAEPDASPPAGNSASAAIRQIFAGLRYAVTRRDLLGSYLADLSAMIFAYPNGLFPFMAVTLHAPWSAGLMFAAPSVGAFGLSAMSGWMSRVRRHGLAIALSAALWGAGIAAFGLSPDIYMALGCLVFAGAADESSGIFRDILWKQSIPDHLRGRMAGVELLSYGGGPPVGQLRSGLTASVYGLRFSLASGGLACVAAVGIVCAALPAYRRYTAPPEPAPAPR